MADDLGNVVVMENQQVQNQPAQPPADDSTTIEVSLEVQLEFELLQMEKEALETEIRAKQIMLNRVNKVIDYKTKKIVEEHNARKAAQKPTGKY